MDVQSPTCLLQFCAASVLSLFPTCSVVLDAVPHPELELRTRATHTSAQAHTTGQADIKDNQETYDNHHSLSKQYNAGDGRPQALLRF